MDDTASGQLFVYCGKCLHSWSLGDLPMTYKEFSHAMRKENLECPECGETKEILMGRPEDEKGKDSWNCGQVVIGNHLAEHFHGKDYTIKG